MNIFVIPSWYPSKSQPIAGKFFREQVLALARARPRWNFIISTWGRDEYGLPLNNPWKGFQNLINFRKTSASRKKIGPNTWEIDRPTLTWNPKILDGNLQRIIKNNFLNFKEAQKIIGDIDLIHAHASYPAGYLAYILSRKFKLPYIITEHMGPFPFPQYFQNGKLLPNVSQSLKEASLVIVVSLALEKKLQYFGFKKTVVIPNMVDEDFFMPLEQKPKNKIYTFFTLGELRPEKGIEDLLRAISKLHQRAIFRIGGEGRYLKNYQALARELKIEKYIKWLGGLSRKQVRREFQGCDAFILPSRHESFGMVYVEALACSKPIIATCCGGPEEIVNQRNGILVKVGDINGIQEAMKHLIKNQDSYHSKKIREDFLKRFSKKTVSKQIIKVYQSLIKGSRQHID